MRTRSSTDTSITTRYLRRLRDLQRLGGLLKICFTQGREQAMQVVYRVLPAVVLAVCFGASTAAAQDFGAPPLFANQYTQGYANQATAEMYLAPVPVPGWVGHTYYTYQPLYPHEMLYWHHNRYHSYYDNGRGLNRTGVHYYAPPVRTGLHGLVKTLSLPRP